MNANPSPVPLSRAVITPGSTRATKLFDAVAAHLGLPVDEVTEYLLTFTSLPDDPVFGPRELVIMQVGRRVHVLRVMTSPLQQKFSVHEEVVL